MAGKRILIVDDEPSILRSTEMLLREMGFEVVTCSTPEAIQPTLAREAADLLLQDVRMPGLDLDGLIQAIRKDPATAHVPILLFSASIDLATIRERVGANGFLEKPFGPGEIREAVETFTGG